MSPYVLLPLGEKFLILIMFITHNFFPFTHGRATFDASEGIIAAGVVSNSMSALVQPARPLEQ